MSRGVVEQVPLFSLRIPTRLFGREVALETQHKSHVIQPEEVALIAEGLLAGRGHFVRVSLCRHFGVAGRKSGLNGVGAVEVILAEASATLNVFPVFFASFGDFDTHPTFLPLSVNPLSHRYQYLLQFRG